MRAHWSNPYTTRLFGPEGDTPSAAGAPQAKEPVKISEYAPPPVDVEAILNGGDTPPPQRSEPAPKQEPQPAPQSQPANQPPPKVEAVDPDDPFSEIRIDNPPPQSQEPKPEEQPNPENRQQRGEENKGLREQLAAANARLKAYESGEGNREIQERLAATLERNNALEGQIHARDPLSHPEVRTLREEMATKFGETSRRLVVTGDNPEFLQGWLANTLPQLVQTGDPNGQAYLKKMGEMRGELGEMGLKPDSIAAVLQLADAGADNTRRTHAKIEDIGKNWGTYEAKTAREAHERIATEWAGVRSGWLKPTEDQINNDPYSPLVYLHKLKESSPEIAKAFDATSKALVETFMPLPPIMPDDLADMPKEEIATYLETRENKHRGRMETFRRNVGNMAAFYRMGPGLLRKLQEQEQIIADLKAGVPVPGGGGGGGPQGGPQGGAAKQDVRTYDPGPLPKID